ncbi:hypothetical protein [Macellibacteroides fermentans]|uniref:hypothetical protein n=1 Tax=Macellibacteroides fermentans TaxID=879969 RepID=UPI00406C32C4
MDSSIIKFANKLELHYYFSDKSYYMDALVRHRCEKEVLTLIRTLADLLEVRLTVYCEPASGDGYKEVWGVAGENARSISVVLSIMMQLFTHPFVASNGQLTIDRSEEDEARMQRELASLRKDLKLRTPGVAISRELIEDLNLHPRVCKCKSNFYESMKGYPKVRKFTVRELNENNKSRSGLMEVKREHFNYFILRTDELPQMKDQKATIEIVSPVLMKDSKLRWKGIYNKGGEIIDFYMRDEDFKRDMVEDKIAFTSGMCIDCVLEIDRKLNEIGEIVNVSYSVVTVIKTRFDKMEIITPQGKKHLKKLEAEKQQLTLDLFA